MPQLPLIPPTKDSTTPRESSEIWPNRQAPPVRYCPEWLNAHDSTALLDELRTQVPWRRDVIRVFGKEHLIPREHALLGDGRGDYTWSGLTMPVTPWPETIAAIAKRLEGELGLPFNSVLLNHYRHGQDAMGWHSDDEVELGPLPCIASLSMGEARDFVFRTKRKEEREASLKVRLEPRSLLVMLPGTQEHWQHAIPRRAKVQGSRYNLTFRYLRDLVLG